MKSELLKKISGIKIFLFDLEGVLIPSSFIENEENEKALFEKLTDGCKQIKELGAKFGIVTSRGDTLISKIKMIKECCILSDSINKVAMVDKLLAEKQIDYAKVFYIGDDLLDIPLLQKCGLSSAPKRWKKRSKACRYVYNKISGWRSSSRNYRLL